MDDMGVDVQVIYPTFFNKAVGSSMAELALARSYNRWMADRCGKSGGRLRWVAVPPLHDIDKTIEELRFAKDHGACGVLKKGDEEAGIPARRVLLYPVLRGSRTPGHADVFPRWQRLHRAHAAGATGAHDAAQIPPVARQRVHVADNVPGAGEVPETTLGVHRSHRVVGTVRAVLHAQDPG